MSQSHYRRESGVCIILLIALLAIFVVGAGTIFSFEFGRVNLAREQLRGCCDAASLAASAAIVGDPTQPEDLGFRTRNAKRIAKEIFARNQVVASHLEKSELTADCDQVKSVKDRQALLSVHFENNRAVVKSVVSYEPALGKLFGLGAMAVRAYSRSGPPKLDVVLVMDISSSMTRDTPYALVSRHAEYKLSKPGDTKPFPPGGPMPSASIVTDYKVLEKSEPDDDDDNEEDGHRWSAFAPQNLKMNQGFCPALRNNRGNTGTPPGNITRFDGEYAFVLEPWQLPHACEPNRIFSDCIVMLDKTDLFPNIATMVEAARGNLDNDNRFRSSFAGHSGRIPENLVGRATRSEYERQARLKLEPLSTAISDVKDFGERLRERTDAHFAFIPFGPYAADSEIGVIRQPLVGNYDPRDLGDRGLGTFPLRQVKLDKQSDRWDRVFQELDRRGNSPMNPLLGTNTADALEQALNMLTGETSGKRSEAKQVVVLISDGLPHAPKRATIRDNENLIADIERRSHRDNIVADTYDVARKLKERGITLITIGFLHNKAAKHRQDGETILRRIAAAAGDEENFFVAKDKEQLQKALAKIERNMIALD